MRLLKAVVLALFSYTILASAQTVDDIVAKNIQAQGGLAKFKAIQSMRVTGNFDAGGMQLGFTQVYKRPMKSRLDASIQGMTLTHAYDGQNGWQINPFGGSGTPEPLGADDLKQIQEDADFEGPLVDYKQKGNTVHLMGKENIEGADAYHLQVILKNGDVRNLYIDANTFLVAKMAGKTVVQGTEVEMETKFTDYREVQGIKFPFSIDQHTSDGQFPGQKITFQKVEVNLPVEDSFFKAPAAGANAATPNAPQPKQPK